MRQLNDRGLQVFIELRKFGAGTPEHICGQRGLHLDNTDDGFDGRQQSRIAGAVMV